MKPLKTDEAAKLELQLAAPWIRDIESSKSPYLKVSTHVRYPDGDYIAIWVGRSEQDGLYVVTDMGETFWHCGLAALAASMTDNESAIRRFERAASVPQVAMDIALHGTTLYARCQPNGVLAELEKLLAAICAICHLTEQTDDVVFI